MNSRFAVNTRAIATLSAWLVIYWPLSIQSLSAQQVSRPLPQAGNSGAPIANRANALDSVGGRHNRLLTELMQMKGADADELWKRQLQYAVRQAGGSSVAGDAEWFRLGSVDNMLGRVPRKIAASRTVLQSVLRLVIAMGERAESYESFAAMVIAEENKTMENTRLTPEHRSALLAGFATARYSANFHANGTGSANTGEVVALRKKFWKELWEKIKPIVGADLVGAAGGCLLGIATTANPAGCGAGALTGGALASYKALGI